MKPYILPNHKLSTVRVSVYDVYYWLVKGYSDEVNLEENNITRDELQAALDFIAANREIVHRRHLELEERNARGNPPEVLAKIEAAIQADTDPRRRAIREKIRAKLEELRDQSSTCGSQPRRALEADAEPDLAESRLD